MYSLFRVPFTVFKFVDRYFSPPSCFAIFLTGRRECDALPSPVLVLACLPFLPRPSAVHTPGSGRLVSTSVRWPRWTFFPQLQGVFVGRFGHQPETSPAASRHGPSGLPCSFFFRREPRFLRSLRVLFGPQLPPRWHDLDQQVNDDAPLFSTRFRHTPLLCFEGKKSVPPGGGEAVVENDDVNNLPPCGPPCKARRCPFLRRLPFHGASFFFTRFFFLFFPVFLAQVFAALRAYSLILVSTPLSLRIFLPLPSTLVLNACFF